VRLLVPAIAEFLTDFSLATIMTVPHNSSELQRDQLATAALHHVSLQPNIASVQALLNREKSSSLASLFSCY